MLAFRVSISLAADAAVEALQEAIARHELTAELTSSTLL